MNLKLICIYIMGIMCSAYLIIYGIKMKKHKVYLSCSLYNDLLNLGVLFPLVINMFFLSSPNYIDITGVFIGIVILGVFSSYILYKRRSYRKINIYNIKKDTVKKYLCQTLDKYNIEYEYEEYYELYSINTEAYITFTGNCLRIKNYNLLPNYKIIIEDLARALEKVDKSEKKKDGNKFIFGGCGFMMFLVLLYLVL